MPKKFNKVFFNKGSAWTIDKHGNKVSVDSLDEANDIQSACCGINCCTNTITLPANDDNGTTSYPGFFEIVVVDGVVKFRVTVDLGAGYVTREVDLS